VVYRATNPARFGRLLLLALVVSLAWSFAGAASPPAGTAAEGSFEAAADPSASVGPGAVVEPTPDVEPTGSVDPSPSVAATPSAAPTPTVAPTASPTLTPTASPTVAPMPSPTLRPAPSPTATPAPTPTVAAPAFPAVYPSHCATWSNPVERANLLLQNRYQLAGHPAVTLGTNPNWTEDPLGNANWRFLHHSLGSVQNLLQAYSLTLDTRYRDRAVFLLKDWLADNPRSGAPSSFSWNDHSTALRGNTFACAALYLPAEAWLLNGLQLHGQTLADPAFYVREGNHALDQSMGLLEIAGFLRRSDWMTLSRDRIGTLLLASVDTQGVTNEQSVGYQNYNRVRYTLAEKRLRAWNLAVPAGFSRIPMMPNFLGHGTRPDGRYEMLGDTDLGGAAIVPGTWAEYAATLGRSGPRPPTTVAVYRAGFMFARTGWGGSGRVFADERFMSLRFGPAPIIHGHNDGGSVGMYGYGTSLLVDPGGYTYNQDAWRSWFKGRTAHNVVTVDGVAYNRSSHTTLSCQAHSTTMAHACVYQPGTPGTSHIRRVTFSRNLGYVLVDDSLASSTTRTYRQLWHLPADAKPLVRSTYFHTQRGRGNLQVRQLLGGTTSRVVIGQTSPIQGWVSYRFAEKAAAPVVEVARTGKTARYLTLLLTAPGNPVSTISGLQVTSTGYRVTVTVDGKRELVVVSGNTASITRLN
jgi:hypothetical protein